MDNRYSVKEIQAYVRRILGHMTEDELAAIEVARLAYAAKIKEKIESPESEYQEGQFSKWIYSGKLFWPSRALRSIDRT